MSAAKPLPPIKPCPFCGNTGTRQTQQAGVHFLTCTSCGATGPTAHLGESMAVLLWNGRRRKAVK